MSKVNELQYLSTKKMAYIGVFITLSFIGSLIKIPSPVGSIALDSAPCFIAAILFGPWIGGIVAFIGHLFSALNTGFPLTIPIHILIGVEMMAISFFIGWFSKINILLALFIGWLLNSFAAPALLILIPNLGVPFFIAVLLPLMISSAINSVIAGIVAPRLKRIMA